MFHCVASFNRYTERPSRADCVPVPVLLYNCDASDCASHTACACPIYKPCLCPSATACLMPAPIGMPACMPMLLRPCSAPYNKGLCLGPVCKSYISVHPGTKNYVKNRKNSRHDREILPAHCFFNTYFKSGIPTFISSPFFGRFFSLNFPELFSSPAPSLCFFVTCVCICHIPPRTLS